MLQARSISRYVLLSLSCLLLLPAISYAKPSGPEPVGHLTASASSVQWMTSGIDHEMVVLTVVGPNGAVFHKEFARGTMPSFRLQDLGGRLTDGSYTYELRMVPRISAEAKKQLAAARAAGDDDAVGRIQSAAGINPEALVQSGSLRVINGAFVSPDVEEPAMTSKPVANSTTSSLSGPKVIKPLDIVQADDVIIQGSLCVGLDCVNNESFGFDTIRLKENNTRIKFDDTSTGTGFPNHNWQLTANDSASGGANKFSIEDITAATVPFTVTGSAPTNSIFVDSTGRLGLRTATPVLDVHVATGNTPGLRLEQNSSGGFTAQTWDVAGNEANFFVRDVTSGSRLPFRIRPGAPTSSIDISASGNVGVGTASPSFKLDVSAGALGFSADASTFSGPSIARASNQLLVNTGTSGLLVNNQANSVNLFKIQNDGKVGIGTTSPGSQLVIASGATTSSANAGDTQFTVASSRTFKENIEPIDVPDILTKIEAVPVVTYDFRNNGPKDRLGLIAEDFHQVFGRGDDKHISGQEVQMALWMAVQKLTAENKALTDRLAKLESEIAQKPQP